MIWLTWRQHRLEVVMMGIGLLLVAIVLLITGLTMAAEGRINGLIQIPVFDAICVNLPFALPALAGIFLGAPALSREFEQETYRLAWTQSIPWSRWLFQKIGLLICAVAGAFAVLFGLFSWWNVWFSATFSHGGWWTSGNLSDRFDTWGIVIIAYAVFAVSLGLFIGAVVRKPVAAMAITLLLFVVVRVLIENYWRPDYLPPVVVTAPALGDPNASVPIPTGAWVISLNTLDQHGQPVSADLIGTCFSQNVAYADQCVRKYGIQNRVIYQPADRFWPLQGIESGIYLLFAALLIAMTFWWMKYQIIGSEKLPLKE